MTAPPVARVTSSTVRGQRLLNVAVLGLGTRWRRCYGPALRSLRDRYRVRAVCDPVQEWADHEARRLGCVSAAGPTELLEVEGVDALLLLDAAWYRLWPLELACRAGKPVFCAPPLDLDDDHADTLARQARQSGTVVMMEMLPGLSPTVTRLRQLLAQEVGPTRLLLCDWAHRVRATSGAHESHPLLGASGGALLHICASVLGADPIRVLASEVRNAGLACVTLEFPDGRATHIVRRGVSARRGGFRFQVVTEHGQATAMPPQRVSWTNKLGQHVHNGPRTTPAVRFLLERFHTAVTTCSPAEPGLEQAHRTLAWLRAIARSRAEGRWVEIEESRVPNDTTAHPVVAGK